MKFNTTFLTAAVLALSGFAAMSGANAETTAGSFDINLQVEKTCKVTAAAAQNIDFGKHSAGAEALEAYSSTPISINCSNGTAYNIGLEGSGFLADATVPANKVAYKLLKASGGEVWGNEATGEIGGTGSGMASTETKNHNVYASLAANATDNLPVGTYKDTVKVTVTY